MAPRPAHGFFIRQNERTAIVNQETEPCPRTPCGSAGTCPGPGLIGSSRRRSPRYSTRCPTLQADEIAGASRYERSSGWKAYRAGRYRRGLTAKAGTLELKVPKLKGVLFESAVVERDRRCEESVEEALTDVCMAGVSTRQVDDISQLP